MLKHLTTAIAHLRFKGAASTGECSDWKTQDFFLTATETEVRNCLAVGADLNAQDDDGWAPLHIAVKGVFGTKVTDALLEAGADPNARAKHGMTPLQAALFPLFNPAVISTLLKAGADLHARVDNGRQALHLAADLGIPTVIDALLDAGADGKARDEEGRTPWDLVQDRDELKGTNAYWRLNDARF